MSKKFIKVIFFDDTNGRVKAFQLDKLISLGMIKMFYHLGKWSTVDINQPIK